MNDQIAHDANIRAISHEINSALIGDIDDANIRNIIGSNVYDEIVSLRKSIRAAADPEAKKAARVAFGSAVQAAAEAAAK